MAISKERLEELIEQGATIYKKRENVVFDYNLKKGNYVENNELMYCNPKTYYEVYVGSIEDLFETKEDAEWHREFWDIERTEKLELPTWEELFKQDRLLDCYTKEFGIIKNRSFIGVVLLGVDFANEIVEVCIGSNQLFVEKLTKENYIKACRKAKELFLGE